MRLSNVHHYESIRKSWFFLLILLLLEVTIFFIFDEFFWGVTFFIFTGIIIVFSFLFWQFFILPESSIRDQVLLSKNILINQFRNRFLILNISKGMIDDNFLILKRKPRIHVLNIDPSSIVFLRDSKGQIQILKHGSYIIREKQHLMGALKYGINCFELGFENHSIFKPRNPHETTAEFQSRINKINRTLAVLSSGQQIISSFTVFYRLLENDKNSKGYESLLLKIFPLNEKLITKKEFEFRLTEIILSQWRTFCSNRPIEKIFYLFPGKFDLADFSFDNLVIQVYVNEILTLGKDTEKSWLSGEIK